MKLKKLQKILAFWSIALLIYSIILNYDNLIGNLDSNLNYQKTRENDNFSELIEELKTSTPGSNYEIISDIFNDKLSKDSSLGHFPQLFEPSLQATYYALYILETLGKLDLINQSTILNYIMAHYDASSHLFMDIYSYRYLDTDFSQCYYPFTSVLEVNCYALLSLDISILFYL